MPKRENRKHGACYIWYRWIATPMLSSTVPPPPSTKTPKMPQGATP